MKSDKRLALILTCLVILWVGNRPLDDYDIFTQVTLGKLILESGLYFPESLVYSPTTAGESVWNPGWLWQILFSWVSTDIDWIVFSIIHCFLFGAIYFVLSRFSPLDEEGADGTLIDTTILWLLGVSNNTSFRPQVVSLLCFVLLYRLLLFEKREKLPWTTLLVLFFLWQNSHVSLVLTLPLIAARFISRALEKDWSKPLFESLCLFCLVAFCYVATPLGLEVLSLSTSNYEISHDILVNLEWHAAWEYGFQEMWAFWLIQGLTVPILFFGRRALKLHHWIVILSYWALALFAARFVLIWSCVMFPIWRLCFQSLSARLSIGKRIVKAPHQFQAVAVLLVGGVFLLGALSRPLYSRKIPLRCIEALDESKPRLFVKREWAGPTAYFKEGKIQTQVDGRSYLYAPETWREYVRIVEKGDSLTTLEAEYAPNQIMLSTVESKTLVQELRNSSRWDLAFEERGCIIFKSL